LSPEILLAIRALDETLKSGIDLDTSNQVILGVSRRLLRVPLSLIEINPTIIRAAAATGFSPGLKLFKRIVDITVATGLGLVALPCLPVIVLAIKLDSRGPVIYKQTRLGMNNRHFSIYKFRTMTKDAEAGGAVYAALKDPRITRVGNLMRRTRIDEIPQLWNVLIGDMSLVGPRPERPENLDRLELAIPEFSARTSVRPGITGWAQVSTVNYASTTEETGRKVEYDFYYIVFSSVWLDVKVMLRTICVILRFRGR
jgi:lipopolysaccharide/colanic/teichoic acid biosynthesis glycosyltransferase